MRYPKRYTRIISARYAALREREERDRDARCAAARRDPAFAAAEQAMTEASLQYARAKAVGRATDDLRKTYDDAKAALDRICADKGYDLSMHVHCDKCGDTGFVGEKLCTCALPLYQALLREDGAARNIPAFTFADNRVAEADCAQSRALTVLYDKMKEFCDRFYETRINFILLTGQSGVGKTSLAYAIANELTAKNVSVCFLSAFEFNDLMLRYHRADVAKRSHYMEFILDCEMLFIDDLGTEPMLKSVTKEYLYNVVDARMLSGKKTMVTSNLNLEELMVRYGERTVSRMTNKRYSLARELIGDDLRKFKF